VTLDELRLLAEGTPAPLPSLITLGTVDGGNLLIDIETAGILSIDADEQQAVALIRRVATELATSTWVDHVDVLAVGIPAAGDIAGAQRVRHLPDLPAALDELAAIAAATSEALAAVNARSTLAARLGENGDAWTPTILVHTGPVNATTLARLQEITGDGGRGVGAIVRSETATTWHVTLDDSELLLAPLGFRVTPAVLNTDTATALDELLTDATFDGPVEIDEAAEVEAPADTPIDAPTIVTGPYEDPPFEVEVRIIGPVEVIGAAAPIDRRRCLEMATYLALHPQGVTDERLKTVLWPDELPPRVTFNTTVSTTRSRLGTASDGSRHFPHFVASGNRYRLGHLVTTDLARFEARVAYAKRCETNDAITTLRSALELVRGQPFEGVRGFEWAYTETLIASIEAIIADAAHHLARLLLEDRDAPGVTWAAMQGLKAAPGDETLYRDRMLACDLAGNPAGVESVMDELCEVVEALEPYDELHPETIALYERVSHQKRARSG